MELKVSGTRLPLSNFLFLIDFSESSERYLFSTMQCVLNDALRRRAYVVATLERRGEWCAGAATVRSDSRH